MFKSDENISGFANLYIDNLRILTDRIEEFNAKFIRDKSGLRLATVLQFTMKIVKYPPLEGRGWQPLPMFLSKTKAVINIQNNDERCVGYALLVFLEPLLDQKHANRESLYTTEMFQRHHIDTLPYPISPNDVHLYKDQLQMNINIFSFFDDEGRARHPLVVSRQNYKHLANLLYWKGHYAPIANIFRMFLNIKKRDHKHQICLRCLRHFRTEESYARHNQLCTRDDFMSVLHVLPTPGSKQAQIKFNKYTNCTKAPFVIYTDF